LYFLILTDIFCAVDGLEVKDLQYSFQFSNSEIQKKIPLLLNLGGALACLKLNDLAQLGK
jgi:hypothetical protein